MQRIVLLLVLERAWPRRCVRTFSAVTRAPSSAISGRRTANSSPPVRAKMSSRRRRGFTAAAMMAEQVVAREVAVRVVDALEVIDVERDERQRALVALASG